MIDFNTVAMSIELAQQAQTVIIRPHIELPPDAPAGLSYRLNVSQLGNGNTSSISQAGTLNQSGAQNTVTLQRQPNGQCTATLELLQGGTVVKTLTQPC
jgi:hypothetical protein